MEIVNSTFELFENVNDPSKVSRTETKIQTLYSSKGQVYGQDAYYPVSTLALSDPTLLEMWEGR